MPHSVKKSARRAPLSKFRNSSFEYQIHLLLAVVFITGMILALFRNASADEVYYLTEALQMSDCFAGGRWIGNMEVGFHGFLYKIPAALLFLITGPSVFAATAVNILIAVSAVYLTYLIYLHILKAPRWALAGSFLVFTSVFFLRALPTFLRDTPVVFTLLLFIYLNLKKKNKWVVGLSLMLLLDAKESTFFMVLPGYVLWVLYDEYRKKKKNPGNKLIPACADRLLAGFIPVILFLVLMLTTTVVPLNPVISKIFGLNYGGFSTFLERFNYNQTTLNSSDKNSRRISPGGTAPPVPQYTYGWKAKYSGKVLVLPDVLIGGRIRFEQTIVLVKPGQESTHTTKGHSHYCRLLEEPLHCSTGDAVAYFLWYKTSSKKTRPLIAVNRTPNSTKPVGIKKIPLINDGKWHYVSVKIPVKNKRIIVPELYWPYGRGMLLNVAGYGCKLKKKKIPI
ncbi:MAG: hypothetical protein GY757_52660 [bacterium]|nr:hypothetical protein [bacterium]